MPSKVPHPGRLQFMIKIGSTVNEINENGYPVETDNVICTVHAAIEDASGKWFFGGDAENVRREVRYIIRWRSDVTEGMWVEHEGKRRTITKINDYDFRHRYMQLTAEYVEGVK